MNKLVDKFEAGQGEGKKELPIKTGPQQGNNQQQSNHVKKEEEKEHNQQQKNQHNQKEKQGTKKELNRTDSRSQMSSKNSSRQGTPPQSSKSGTQMVRMSDSGCSPIGNQSPLEKQQFSGAGRPSKGGGQLHSGRHDFQDDMPQPRKKTQIIYDLGSPETCTQGMNACIPVTTDKYTYTITSVLTRSGSSTSPPLSPTSSLGGGPISSSRCTNKHVTARMGRSSPAREVFQNMEVGNIP